MRFHSVASKGVKSRSLGLREIKHLNDFGDAFSLLSQSMPKVSLDEKKSHVRRRADELDLPVS